MTDCDFQNIDRTNRRDFLRTVQAAAVSAALVSSSDLFAESASDDDGKSYPYRIAFGCWIGDMRNTPLPLQKWPAPQLDEEAVDSFITAMDVQSKAGFNYLDAWGLFATYGYPADVSQAFADPQRRKQVERILAAAKERGLKYLFGMGLFSWGYDEIIKADPEVQGHNAAGQPLQHVMCGAKEKAWKYVEKILDLALTEFDFAGVHLESADLGYCDCPECAGKFGRVGYNARLNIRAAEYIRSKWPGKIINCIPINWLPLPERKHFNDEELGQIIELSNHINGFMDQGWNGTFVPESKQLELSKKLGCAYGTSGGLWVYHTVRWDRSAYFLPYANRSSAAIRRHHAQGARACMVYQGPMANPGAELNTAVCGRVLCDVKRSTEDVLGEVTDLYYRPKSASVRNQLVAWVLRAEEAYFGQWKPESFESRGGLMPGELHLTALFDETPGAASYLLEPYLTAEARRNYRKELVALLGELPGLAEQCDDGGRLRRIQTALATTAMLVDTIRQAKGES